MQAGLWLGIGLAVALAAGGCRARPAGGAADSGGRGEDAGPADGDGGTPFDPGPEPEEPMRPVVGEVTIVQLDLPIGLSAPLGEAAIIVGPDGTVVLLDVGDGGNDDDVREAVRALNENDLVPARGFEARSPLQVEWILITHFHSDHVGAFAGLTADAAEPLEVVNGVVHRGWTDVGAGVSGGDYQAACDALRGPLASLDRPLCTAVPAAPCDPGAFAGTYPAAGCAGLHLGDLADPGDDALGEPTFVALGGGARLVLVAANGHASDGTPGVDVAAPAFGVEASNEENARSLAGLVTHGEFRYHFGGDMTGSGLAGEPDVESHLAATAGAFFYAPLGADAIHAHHHARNSSSNAAVVDLLAPLDGLARNVIAGINPGYLGSPQSEVVTAWLGGDRLGAGWFWVPDVAPGGDTHPRLVEANGPVIVQTLMGGRGYRVQAAGAALFSAAYESVGD